MSKTKLYTRRQRHARVEEPKEGPVRYRLTRKQREQEKEIERMTKGCAPDFERLP